MIMNSFGVSSSFLRRCSVSFSSDATYAWRSCTWISYSVSRRRALESDMEEGRNLEKPSRLGLPFLSNSFIAHPFLPDPSCAARAVFAERLSEYRRRLERKSRLRACSASLDSLNLQCFSPPRPPFRLGGYAAVLPKRVQQVLYLNRRAPSCWRNG